MYAYYVRLSLRSLRRNVWLAALMIMSIGLGVALAMSTWSLVHLMSRDPIPAKSAKIFFPTIDIWGPAAREAYPGREEPPSMFDYSTSTALLTDHRAKYQSAVYWITPTVIPSLQNEHPFNASGFAVTSEFFPMLNVSFKYGGSWGVADDDARAQLVVISQRFNDKIFEGANSVGKEINISGQDYRIVGVTEDWNPQPTYYHIPAFGGFMLQPTDLFLPFNTAIGEEIPVDGSKICIKAPDESGFTGLMHSDCAWIGYLTQLDNSSAVRDYQSYLENFSRQRFSWSPAVRLRNLMDWLDYQQVVPSGIQILRYVGIGLLIICLVNTIGLLLAKFLRRSGEIGIRRAVGATRSAIYAQFLTEGALIGVAGGVVGILLTWLAMQWLRHKFPQGWEALTQLDSGVLALTVVVAVIATLVAAIYPAWRAAHVEPAWQVKLN